jgi:hypothetical protein
MSRGLSNSPSLNSAYNPKLAPLVNMNAINETIIFPHANKKRVSLATFLAAWRIFSMDNFNGIEEENWSDFVMPLLHRKANFDHERKGLDMMCRLLAGYINVMQPTKAFFEANGAYIEHIPKGAISPVSDRKVAGANLTKAARNYWRQLAEEKRQEASTLVEALLTADQEDEDIVASADIWSVEYVEVTLNQKSPKGSNFNSRNELLLHIIEQIHEEPYQAYYRKQPHGKEISTWPKRYSGYFWPSPAHNGEIARKPLKSIYDNLRRLIESIANYREQKGVQLYDIPLTEVWEGQKTEAETIARDIFSWGGVPQRNVTAENVFKVIINALTGKAIYQNAPMNSGWTKLAAFGAEVAASFFENITPQVIWDSRVSNSVIKRLNQHCLAENTPILQPMINELRLISGRGGFRPKIQGCLKSNGWSVGWGGNPWQTHFAGGALIEEFRKILNGDPGRFGTCPHSQNGEWSLRAVEMVLFMDGY